MLGRIKRKLKRVIIRVFRLNRGENGPSYKNYNDSVYINDEQIVLKRDNLEENLSLVNEMVGHDDKLIPHRKVTHLKWNGPILAIKGYYYLEDIPLLNYDFVKKRLVLVSGEMKSVILPLQDIELTEIEIDKPIEAKYKWAGFEGEFNFSTVLDNNKPLPEAEYKAYLEIEVRVLGDRKYVKMFPLGDIRPFLNKGFHSTKMEYFSSKKELKYNLLATFDQPVKTLKITSSKLKDMDPSLMALDAPEKLGVFYRGFYTVGFRTFYKLFTLLLPVKKDRILFASDSRTEMSGNFAFVYEEMVKRNLSYDYQFMLKGGIASKKTFGEIIKLAKLLATSKYIIVDDYYPMVYPLTIRHNAELIQLWHAVGAFKTFGFSRIGRPGGPSPKSRNHRNYTKAIVSSKNVAKHYAEGFGIDEEKVVPTGIPRTDVFFDEAYQESVKEKLYEEYPFLKDKKVITFAPTFRGNGQQSAHYHMEVLDLEKIYHELKDEYVFLFKIHPFVKNDFSIPYQYSDFFYDFSEYREINDLLFVTDILITDYSSVCFEYALLRKPMIFFAYDVEEYVKTRDFYYEYHSFIPGPLARTTDDMINCIQQNNFEQEKIEPFVRYFFDHLDGKSSARVVDELILETEPEEKATIK